MQVWHVMFCPDAASAAWEGGSFNLPAADIVRSELVGITKQGYRISWRNGSRTVTPDSCFGDLEEAKTYARKLNEETIEREKKRHAAWLKAASELLIEVQAENA